MAMNRATLFFRDTNDHGWSETYHTLLPTLPLALDRAKVLAYLRRQLMGGQTYNTYIRVSDDLVTRDSLIYAVPPDDQQVDSWVPGNSASANLSLVTRIQASALVRRTLYMRGIPTTVIPAAGKFVNNASFDANFRTFRTELVTQQWACRTKDRLIVVVDILEVTQNPATGVTLVRTAPNHGLVRNGGVQIRGCIGSEALNGTHAVLDTPTLTTFTVLVPTILAGYLGGGVAQKVGYTLVQMIDATIVQASERKAGRIFNSPRGRRSVRGKR